MVKNTRQAFKNEEPPKGVVTGCSLLYIRRQPNATSEVSAILPALTEVIVDPEFKSDTHYRIVVPALVRKTKFANFNFENDYHGYCDKTFISLKG